MSQLHKYFNPIRFLVSNSYRKHKKIGSRLVTTDFKDLKLESKLFSYEFENNELVPIRIEDPVVKFISHLLGCSITSKMEMRKFDDKYNLVVPIGLIPTHHMLRIMDLLQHDGYNIIPLHDKTNPYIYKHIPILDDHTSFHADDVRIYAYLNTAINTYQSYKIMCPNNMLLNDLFDEYNKLNSFNIRVKDRRWTPYDATVVMYNPNHIHPDTQHFLDTSRKYNSLVCGVDLITKAEGGIKVYSECPMHDFLISEGKKFNKHDEKGNMRWLGLYSRNNILWTTGFSPFWIKIYLVEMMSQHFKNVILESYR